MSCSNLLESLATIVSTDRHYRNSWIAQRSTTIVESEFYDLQVNRPDIFYALLNIILYDNQSSLMFVPHGTKCTHTILKKTIPTLEKIICEVFVKFNLNYYQNLKEEFPSECKRFNITKEIMAAQKRIYGYFVWCSEKPSEKFSYISHAFTNINTIVSLHMNTKRNTDELNHLAQRRSLSVCVTGSIVDSLLGRNSDEQTVTEFLTYDAEKQGLNVNLLRMGHSPFIDMAILVNCEKKIDYRCDGGKIKWGHETLLVPRQNIRACQVPLQVVLTPLDLLHKESLLVYYRGMKFLCMSPGISSVLASSPPAQLSFMNKNPLNIRIFRCRSPSLPEMTQNVRKPKWQEKISRMYQTPPSGSIKIFPNCFLTDHVTSKNSIWILRKDGSFDLVAGDFYFVPWILTSSYISFGTISRGLSSVTATYLGNGNNIPVTKFCMNHNISQKEMISINFIAPLRKRIRKNRPIKQISPIIQDERPKRNNVSVLSALLQRDR